MAARDFTLSFTVDDLPFWIDNTEGKVGGKSTIHFVDQAIATAGAGGQSNFAGLPLVTFENIGGKATIHFVDQSVNTDGAGGQSNFAGIPIVTFENVGGKATIHFVDQGIATQGAGGQTVFESGQFVFFNTIRDIIHYTEDAEINADELVFNEEMFAGPYIETIGLDSTRRLITDHSQSGTLDVNESWSVNVNTSAVAGVTITLPSGAPIGVNYTFIKTSVLGTFDIQTQLGEFIAVSGVDITGITLDSIGTKINMVFDGISRWISVKEN